MSRKRRVTAYLSVICILALVTTGCSNALKTENEKLSDANKQIETKLAEQTEQINKLNDQLKETKGTQQQLPAATELFPLYTADVNDMKQKVGCYIAVLEDSDLKTKLTQIANSLSQFYFSSLPIEVTEIDSGKIAHINLKEQGTNKNSWAQTYFQGSTGGQITTIQLVQSFLQKDYTRDWIAGLEFTYNGKPIEAQHIPDLAQIIHR